MTVQTDVKAYFGTALQDTIGDRLYPMSLPQDATLPAVMYLLLPGRRIMAHDGDIGLAHFRIQFNCLALTPDDAEVLANSVVDVANTWFQSDRNYAAFPGTPQGLPEPELSRFRMIVDVEITHKE